MITAVIIDDEKNARESLANDLRNYCPEVVLAGEAGGVISGYELILNLKPRLVFLDIEMADGSGFHLLEKLKTAGESVNDFHLIFTTSHDEFAIKAIRFSALDYLLKPIDPDELTTAVTKALEQQNNKDRMLRFNLLLETMSTEKKISQKIALSTSDSIHFYDINDIIRCESQRNYTLFHFQNEKPLLVSRTLKEFEELLKENMFMRVHNSHLVNMNKVKKFMKSDGGYLLMQDHSSIPVTQSKKEQVIQILSAL